MNYRIQITRTEVDPKFQEKIAAFKVAREDRWNRSGEMVEMPVEEVVKNVLLVELTEEQFKVVKLEVMKVFI